MRRYRQGKTRGGRVGGFPKPERVVGGGAPEALRGCAESPAGAESPSCAESPAGAEELTSAEEIACADEY